MEVFLVPTGEEIQASQKITKTHQSCNGSINSVGASSAHFCASSKFSGCYKVATVGVRFSWI